MRKYFWSFLVFLTLFATQVFAADQVFFYYTDPAGTPLSMTDSSGAVVWKADYKPFGEENLTTGEAANDRRFVGKEKDEETGLSYFGARYEDARTGRFIAPDPVRAVDPKTSKTNEKILGNPQRLNTYAYGLNNPNKYVDPDGREPLTALATAFFANLFLGSDANAPEYRYSPTTRSQTATEFAGGVALMETGGRLVGGVIGRRGGASMAERIEYQIDSKIQKQMGPRGWSTDLIEDTLSRLASKVSTRDTRWLQKGARMDDPATAFVRSDGSYVVRNNNSGDIVQVSNRNTTNWKAPWSK